MPWRFRPLPHAEPLREPPRVRVAQPTPPNASKVDDKLMTDPIVLTALADRSVRVERFGPGESAANPQPGDFILVRADSWVGRLVCLLQWLVLGGRTHGSHLRWSHVALVAGRSGRIIEVVYAGIRAGHIEQYRNAEYHYVHIDAPLARRVAAVKFAESCLGHPYGRLSLLAVAIAVMTRGRYFARAWPLHNCAALVALALTRTGAIFPRASHWMMPADLARHYKVMPPIS